MLPKEKFLKLAELKHLLSYDLLTGVFKWKVAASNRVRVGSIAGTTSPLGYRLINIRGVTHQAHRLAWFYCYGVWPSHDLDHRDGMPGNNRIANLREATKHQNMYNNKRKPGRHGKGVCRWGKQFAARIGVNSEVILIGVFQTPEEASAAYIRAAKKYHKEFASF